MNYGTRAQEGSADMETRVPGPKLGYDTLKRSDQAGTSVDYSRAERKARRISTETETCGADSWKLVMLQLNQTLLCSFAATHCNYYSTKFPNTAVFKSSENSHL